jgi:hypothetical protein
VTTRLRCVLIAAALVLTSAGWPSTALLSGRDPFQFLAPSVVLSDSERRRLERDEVVARMLHAEDGQLAVFVATRLNAPPDALVAWTRAIAELKRSKFVLAVGRFSDPPRGGDLDTLRLDERDLDSIRACVPTECGLKLSASEITSLKAAAVADGSSWREAVDLEFRRLLVARVNAYRSGGLGALAASADRDTPASPEQVFTSIVTKSPYLKRLPHVEAWLQGYPRAVDPHLESFFYWSKEYYGAGKPVISVTHVGIFRPETDRQLPAVVIASKQIFATHYIEGALGLTIVMRDASDRTPYLVYLNRSRLDLLRGVFGGITRSVLESRLKRHAPQVVRGLRSRLESGHPPDEVETLSFRR